MNLISHRPPSSPAPPPKKKIKEEELMNLFPATFEIQNLSLAEDFAGRYKIFKLKFKLRNNGRLVF